MSKDKIESSDKTSIESNIQTRDNLFKDAELLSSFKKVLADPDGIAVLRYILKKTNVLSNPFTNSGQTAFALGEQNIGREIMFRIADTGYEIKVSDLVEGFNENRLENIYKKIAILNTKITEESK